MENQVELAELFFELASDSRLSILRELQGAEIKMQEIARRLDVTATEAFRQLERLSAALLVTRQPEGTYTITPYGKLVLQLSSPLSFLLKHREYFSTHDAHVLPYQFIHRLGELDVATFIADTMESLNKAQRLFIEMTQFGWGMAEGVIPELMGPVMDQQVSRGIKMRFLIPESKLPPGAPRYSELGDPRFTRNPCSYSFERKRSNGLPAPERWKNGLLSFLWVRPGFYGLGERLVFVLLGTRKKNLKLP